MTTTAKPLRYVVKQLFVNRRGHSFFREGGGGWYKKLNYALHKHCEL